MPSLVQYTYSSDEDDSEYDDGESRKPAAESGNNLSEASNSGDETKMDNSNGDNEKQALMNIGKLGADDTVVSDEDEEENVEEKGDEKKQARIVQSRRRSSQCVIDYARLWAQTPPDELELPPLSKQECPASLQQKVIKQINMYGKDDRLVQQIKARKDFRNPSIYEKLLIRCKINERGTNIPKEDYNPDFWMKQPTYEDLARVQREVYQKMKESEKKTKVEHVTGTAKKPSSRPSSAEPKTKKSKWDKTSSGDSLAKQAQHNNANAKYPYNVVTTAAANKTSIPGVGQLVSKEKRTK